MYGLDFTTLAAFLVASIAIELTPGPNMAYLAILGVERGRAAGMFAVAGVALGLAIVGALAALGLAALVAEVGWLYQALRWAGIVYLLWLGYDSWRDSRRPLTPSDLAVSHWSFFRRGLITNLLNPKAAAFYLAVLPNFLPAQSSGASYGLLAAIYVAAATVIHLSIVLAASTLQPYFLEHGHRERLGIVFGLALAGVAVWLFFATRI